MPNRLFKPFLGPIVVTRDSRPRHSRGVGAWHRCFQPRPAFTTSVGQLAALAQDRQGGDVAQAAQGAELGKWAGVPPNANTAAMTANRMNE